MTRDLTRLPGPADATGRAGARWTRTLSWVLAAGVVGCEIAYPLVDGPARSVLTVATVVAFFAASLTHAAASRGVAWAGGLALVAVTAGFGVELLGVRTGYPFGEYRYGDSLGPTLAEVPVVIPLAWAMMAYPALLVGQRLSRPRPGPRRPGRRRSAPWWAVALVGGWALASWDLFLDPQMVAGGHWRWVQARPALPGVDGVPLSNFAGWLAVAVALVGVLHVVLPRGPATGGVEHDEGVPALLYLWTFASSVLAHAVFFGTPGVALAGGLAMGAVALPYAYRLWTDRP